MAHGIRKIFASPLATFLACVLFSIVVYSANIFIDYRKSVETGTYRRLLTSYDITSSTFLPYEIIRNTRLYFGDETVGAMRAVEAYDSPHSLININGRYVSAYPVMSGILAVPIYLLPLVLGKIPNLDITHRIIGLLLLGRISAIFYTSLSVGMFYLIMRRYSELKQMKIGAFTYLFVLFFAFCTNVYSISSRGLWQHTSSLFFNSLIVLLLFYTHEKPKLSMWLGALCGLSFLSRPTNLLFILPVAVYILMTDRKILKSFVLGALPLATIYAFYNFLTFGSPFVNEYMAKSDTAFSSSIWVGLVGYLFSPARSFLFISPPLVLAYFGLYKLIIKRHAKGVDLLMKLLGVGFILTMIMYSMWWCWYGADRFGYGFFTEWLHFLVLLSYTQVVRLKKIGKVLIVVLMIYSFYAQFNAVWYRKSRCNKDHNWDFYCLKPGMFSVQEY